MAVNPGWLAATVFLLGANVQSLWAANLPEDRLDLLYQSYDGGGLRATGPSVMLRKSVMQKVSLLAHYRQQSITDASIEELARPTAYSRESSDYKLGADWLANNALLWFTLGQTSRDDFSSDALSLGVRQYFFAGMSSVALSYSQSDDTLWHNEQADFAESASRRRFGLEWSQILTQSWKLALGAETVIDQGYLSNPYREVRIIEPIELGGVAERWQSEALPDARNSYALTLRSIYYLPYRAALRLEGRLYRDNWDLSAANYELRYIHPLADNFVLELKSRMYRQTEANFYADSLTAAELAGNEFHSRSRELSAYDIFNLGLGFTYEFRAPLPFTRKQSLGMFWDFMRYDYDNFRNTQLTDSRNQSALGPSYAPGEEPGYRFESSVVRIFLTAHL